MAQKKTDYISVLLADMAPSSASIARSRKSLLLNKNIVRPNALVLRNSIHRSSTPIHVQVYERIFQRLRQDVLAPLYKSSKPHIAGYYPIGSEFDIIPLLQLFYGHHYKVSLPVVNEGYDNNESPLIFWEWIPGATTVKGKFNIPIPIKEETRPIRPDLLFVPLVAFDLSGRRLGYGGGYYDKTIEKLRGYRRNSASLRDLVQCGTQDGISNGTKDVTNGSQTEMDIPYPIHNNHDNCEVTYTTDKMQCIKPNSTVPPFKLLNVDLPLLICGVGFDQQQRGDLDELEEPHDQQLDIVITESSMYICNNDIKRIFSTANI